MINIMEINSHRAVINFDPDIDMFRGEFLGLSGGADFYAKDIKGLRKEGELSLEIYLEDCKNASISPYKSFSGKFQVRLSPKLHESVVTAAEARGISLNKFIEEAVRQSVE